jgi:hypothetical protein
VSVIADLVRAGVDPDLIARVAEAMAEERAKGAVAGVPSRSRHAEAQARYRAKKAAEGDHNVITVITDDHADQQSEGQKEMSPRPPIRKTTSLTIVRENSRARKEIAKPSEDDFARLRNAYPRRTGGDPRDTAWKAFAKAVSAGEDVEAIISGARAFAVFRSADDPKFTPMLATWLNRRGWLDDYTGPKPRAGPATGGQRKDGWLEMYRKVHGLGEFADEQSDQAFDGEDVAIDAAPLAIGYRD